MTCMPGQRDFGYIKSCLACLPAARGGKARILCGEQKAAAASKHLGTAVSLPIHPFDGRMHHRHPRGGCRLLLIPYD